MFVCVSKCSAWGFISNFFFFKISKPSLQDTRTDKVCVPVLQHKVFSVSDCKYLSLVKAEQLLLGTDLACEKVFLQEFVSFYLQCYRIFKFQGLSI